MVTVKSEYPAVKLKAIEFIGISIHIITEHQDKVVVGIPDAPVSLLNKDFQISGAQQVWFTVDEPK